MLRVLEHETALTLRQGYDVVPLAEELHRLSDRAHHVIVRRQLVDVAKSFTCDWDQLRVEHSLSDPLCTAMTLVTVICTQRALQNGLQAIFRIR